MTTATAAIDRVRAALLKLRRAFDARARRERLLLIGAAIAVVWMIGDSLWLTPAFKGWTTARTRQAAAATALQRLNTEIAQRGNEARGAEQQLRGEIIQARERVSQGDAALRAFGATLVGAAEMVPMLDRLLAQSSGVRLRSMQTLPRSEVGAATPAAANTAGGLYRHGVELSVEGGYADVLAYLRAIESMPQHVLWGGLQLKVEQHPLVVVTLRLYTLSPDRNWLEI
jgi:MSHA biogenesis protein MshJ